MDTSDARPCGLWYSVRQISITKMAKQKKQYDNTNDIVLDVWRSVLLAGYGMWRTLAGASGIIGNSGQRWDSW